MPQSTHSPRRTRAHSLRRPEYSTFRRRHATHRGGIERASCADRDCPTPAADGSPSEDADGTRSPRARAVIADRAQWTQTSQAHRARLALPTRPHGVPLGSGGQGQATRATVVGLFPAAADVRCHWSLSRSATPCSVIPSRRSSAALSNNPVLRAACRGSAPAPCPCPQAIRTEVCLSRESAYNGLGTCSGRILCRRPQWADRQSPARGNVYLPPHGARTGEGRSVGQVRRRASLGKPPPLWGGFSPMAEPSQRPLKPKRSALLLVPRIRSDEVEVVLVDQIQHDHVDR